MLAGRWYFQWLGKPDSELGLLLDCLGSLCPQGKAGFFPFHVKLKLFGVYISSWLCSQTVIDRVLELSYGQMGHTHTFLKAKIFSSQTNMFFLSVVIQRVQVGLCSAAWVSSAVTEGFQWHRAAFQNKLVFINPLGWHKEQGQVCVAKLNLRWSLWGLKQPLWISKPIGCPLCPSVWSPCFVVLATAPWYLRVLFL